MSSNQILVCVCNMKKRISLKNEMVFQKNSAMHYFFYLTQAQKLEGVRKEWGSRKIMVALGGFVLSL